eukprot:CAMPEP_0201596428 /NCGR_PEP_ID=MMETSP0190_2-20130828/193113_1 /ASSEMBLY_ACC=CAM_ASM_000263 /TAXON_ID=37353 /ORGANISM="Rosalina sp." /LENGTH=597 /DNA_ID=CAMNT_0048056771 /DNA_START=1396 /DNA_END=3189 /DNA_ORIENTATION=-
MPKIDENKSDHNDKEESKDNDKSPLSGLKKQSVDANTNTQPPWTMNRTMYEYNNGNFSQSNFHNHVNQFMNNNEQFRNPVNMNINQFNPNMAPNINANVDPNYSPIMQAGVISDDISNVSQEIDAIIQNVETGIKGKINEFRQKEQGYIMILRSIEAERSKLIDDVNRDITMLKYSVKESLDNLQQKFIAKMIRKHVDYVNNNPNTDYPNDDNKNGNANPNGNNNQKPKNKSKAKNKSKNKTLVQSPLVKPALGVIQEEPNSKDGKKQLDDIKLDSNKDNINENHSNSSAPLTINDETKEDSLNNHKNNGNKGHQSPPNPEVNNQQNQPSPNPHPANSQSPNPTQSALQQQQNGLIPKPNSSTMINAALGQQAQFQKHLMTARQIVKQNELQRQKMVNQRHQQAQQHFALQTNNMMNNNGNNNNNNNNNNWWQRGANMYGVSHYSNNYNNNNPNQHQNQSQQAQNQNGQPGIKPKSKKKRRKKKKRNKKNQQQNQQQQQQQQQLEGNLNNMAMPHNMLNGNMFINNGLNGGLNNPINANINAAMNMMHNNHNQGSPIQQNGINGINGNLNNIHQFQAPFNPMNNGSALNPNAMTFKQ